jgi:ATP-dependent DNA ligase
MEWRISRRPGLLPAGFIEPCLPTVRAKGPRGPQWIHEIKRDGYRLIVRKAGRGARIFTRRGFDWTPKFPLILEALKGLNVRSVTRDGEAVWCGKDGFSNFEELHSQAYNDDVFLYAFDLLELNGDDLRKEPLESRKGKLEKLLSNGGWGLRFVGHLDGDGPVIFHHACKMKLEGIVSKRKDWDIGLVHARCGLRPKIPLHRQCAGSSRKAFRRYHTERC